MSLFGEAIPLRASPGVRLTFTVYLEVPAQSLSTLSTSPGVFRSLQRIRRRESTACQFLNKLPGFCRDSTNDSHIVSYGFTYRFSQPLSDLFLSSPSHHFQMGFAPGIPPYRGLFLSRRPDGSSPPACPHAVFPDGCAGSGPRKSHPGRPELKPRGFNLAGSFRLQGFGPRKSRSASIKHVNAGPTDLPLLGFHLPMVYLAVLTEPFTRFPSRFGEPNPKIGSHLRSTVFTRQS